MPPEFLQPSTLEGALQALRSSDGYGVVVWGGGTSLAIMMKQGLIDPGILVGLRRVPGLGGVARQAGGGLRLGGGARLRELETSPLLAERLPALARAAAGIGNVRVRSTATLAGHLVHADPAQDLPPLLLVLDATVGLESADGRRVVPLEGFFVDLMQTAIRPDELLTDVWIPAAALRRRSAYVKFAPRSRDDYGTVGVAVSVRLVDGGRRYAEVRIAVGGAGPVATRIPPAERALQDRQPSEAGSREAARLAAEHVDPWDDARGSAAYKRAMVELWTARILERLARRTGGGR